MREAASYVDRILRGVADTKARAHTTLRNTKNFLSGALRYAVRNDLIATNPARDAVVPRGKPLFLSELGTMIYGWRGSDPGRNPARARHAL